MHAQKLTKSISVSNFSSKQLDCVLEKATVKPVVNQLPYSVAYHPGDVIPENNKRGLLVQAWAPLGGSLGGRFDKNVKDACVNIGKNHGNKSFAQVRRFFFRTGCGSLSVFPCLAFVYCFRDIALLCMVI
jgi:diketogulonate reductase-like aldo/keto reductase